LFPCLINSRARALARKRRRPRVLSIFSCTTAC
jgi:hypothetical protein